jgi:large subunit ribosomal protein L10
MAKQKKVEEVQKLSKLIEEHPIFGIIDMHKLPSRPLQNVKKKLRDIGTIKMTKKSILLFALKSAKVDGIQKIESFIPQQPAIILSKQNPFKTYALVDKVKTPAPAKEGDVAPDDIKVSAGPTNLMPGPAISELTKVGIPAGVEEGKIAVKKDVVVAKKGVVISKPLASALRKLNIEPMLIGVNVVALFEKGIIYGKESLSLVGEGYVNKLREAFQNALNLSVSISYPTKENISLLLVRAQREANALEKLTNKGGS